MSSRAWIVAGIAAAGLVAAVAVANLAGESDAPSVAATSAANASPTSAPTTAAISAPLVSESPTPLPTTAGLAPGDLVATISGDTVDVYDNAGDDAPRETHGRLSYFGNVRTFMGLETTDVDGVSWILVQLPLHPNNSQGWIRADQVTTDSTDLRIDVFLDEREVDLVRADNVELTSTAVIGAAESPTPLGAYFITDPVDFTASPSPAYGAYALGLSAYSETLETFKGALPQIALHGTGTDEFFGQAVSNGCIRLPDDAIRTLAAQASLGTPVVIHQSRADAAAAA